MCCKENMKKHGTGNDLLATSQVIHISTRVHTLAVLGTQVLLLEKNDTLNKIFP